MGVPLSLFRREFLRAPDRWHQASWLRWLGRIVRRPPRPRRIHVTGVSEAWLVELVRDSSRPVDS